MNAQSKNDNYFDYCVEDTKFDYGNILNHRNTQNLSKRKFARCMASLICQTHQIQNDLIKFANQKHISRKELEKIQSSSELYGLMSVLISDWKKFYLHCQAYANPADSWSIRIIANENQRWYSKPNI